MANSVNEDPNETNRLVPTGRTFNVPYQRRSLLSSLFSNKAKQSHKVCSCAPRQICVPSAPALVIFTCTVMVGLAMSTILVYLNHNLTKLPNLLDMEDSRFLTVLLINITLAVMILFYPLAGFIADVCCGRYKMIVTSIILLWCASVLATITIVFAITAHYYLEDIFSGVSVLIGIFGICGYVSNIIQFGFDQLVEAPSCYLSMFVHWYTWSESIAFLFAQIFSTLYECLQSNTQHAITGHYIVKALPMLYAPIISVILIVMYILHRRHLFRTERVSYNPYKLILKVLVFRRKNKCPVSHPSAFVYSGNRRVTRIDFAKKIYGGPFDNADVEDVKAFGRVVCLLLCVAPVFILEVPVSYSLVTVFVSHSSSFVSNTNISCSWEWGIFGNYNLPYITQVIFFPVYIWIVFSVFRNRVPAILTRLGWSVLLYILAVVSMLVVDLTGHIALDLKNKTNVMCMFVQPIPLHDSDYKTLHLHWALLILPSMLIGVAPKLLKATSLEFISAQTPHSMKGVMIGMLFAIKGLSQTVSAVLTIPFSLPLWKHGHLGHHPPVTSCGFGYFMLTILIAVFGFVCFVVHARKYQYRDRGEEVYSQSQVEEIFDRHLQIEQELRCARDERYGSLS